MFKLDNERNIYATGTPPTEAPADFTPRFQQVTRSPIEEMQARVAAHDGMEPIPDSFAALILQTQRQETVAANGISFTLDSKTYRYHHADSRSCHPSNVGNKVLFTFKRNDMSVIYVLANDGRYLEAVPQAEQTEWFDPKMDEKIQENRRVAQHVHQGLKKTHAKTTKQEHDRTKANAEALQVTHSMTTPDEFQRSHKESTESLTPQQEGRMGKTDSTSPARRPSFARADEVQAAQESIGRQKAEFEGRQKEQKRNLRKTSARAQTLLDTPEEQEEEVHSAAEVRRERFSAKNLI